MGYVCGYINGSKRSIADVVNVKTPQRNDLDKTYIKKMFSNNLYWDIGNKYDRMHFIFTCKRNDHDLCVFGINYF